MEFLKKNYFETTSAIVVQSNTDSAQYLIDRDQKFQYVTSGYTGSTVSSIRINFSETMTVSRLALLNHNLKGFRFYYDGVTANTFAMTTSADTTSADYVSNSSTSNYLRTTPVFCTSVSVDLKSTIVSGSERAIGWLVVSDLITSLDRPPPARGYTPTLNPMDVVHKLSDGGTRVQTVSDKFNVQLSYNHLSLAQRSSLKSLYDSHTEMIFCPFGTSTGWDEVIFPAVWEGAFEFYKYSDDAVSAGFSGKIMLRETPS